MNKMFVICQDEFPYEVCPVGTTKEQVKQRCKDLMEKEKQNWPNSRVYFHWHEVKLANLEKPDTLLPNPNTEELT